MQRTLRGLGAELPEHDRGARGDGRAGRPLQQREQDSLGRRRTAGRRHDERVADRRALERDRGVVAHSKLRDERGDRRGAPDASERLEGGGSQGRGAAREERRYRVDRGVCAERSERPERLDADAVVHVAKGDDERLHGPRITEQAEPARDRLPHLGHRVLDLPDEGHHRAPVTEPGQRVCNLHTCRRARIVELPEQRGDGVGAPLRAERVGCRAAHLRVRVAEGARELRHRSRARRHLRDLAGRQPRSWIPLAQPSEEELRRFWEAPRDRGAGREQTHLEIGVLERPKNQRLGAPLA